jgi:hypothetical protein
MNAEWGAFEFFKNPCFWAGFCGWTGAQMTKALQGLYRTHRFDVGYFTSTGGMPSAHAAMVAAVATAVGIRNGFNSDVFVVSLALALIVMFDAATLRRTAGLQSRLLNEIINELFREHRLSEHKLGELLGHTGMEVFAGSVLGILAALAVLALPWFP